jgi:hypothetical protein
MELTDNIISVLLGVGAASIIAILGVQLRIWIRLQKVSKNTAYLIERVDVIERMTFQGFTGRSGV